MDVLREEFVLGWSETRATHQTRPNAPIPTGFLSKKSAWFKASRPQSQLPRRMKCSWEGESEGSKWRSRRRDKAREGEGSWDGAETYRSLYRLVISNVYVSNRAPDMSALDPDRKGVFRWWRTNRSKDGWRPVPTSRANPNLSAPPLFLQQESAREKRTELDKLGRARVGLTSS